MYGMRTAAAATVPTASIASAAACAAPAAPSPLPETLRTAVFRCGERAAGVRPGLPTGHAALDAELPGGGWPVAGLTELLCDALGAGEVSLLAPAFGRASRGGAGAPVAARGIVWVAPPHLPYAPALAAAGVDLSRLLIVRPRRVEDAYWAAEQALRSGACGAVLAWAGEVRGADSAQRYQRLRRLQLAAQAGETCGFVISPSACAAAATPAALRLRVQAAPDGRLEAAIVKRRGLYRPVKLLLEPRRLPVAWLSGASAAAAAQAGAMEATGAAPPAEAPVPAASAPLVRARDFAPAL